MLLQHLYAEKLFIASSHLWRQKYTLYQKPQKAHWGDLTNNYQLMFLIKQQISFNVLSGNCCNHSVGTVQPCSILDKPQSGRKTTATVFTKGGGKLSCKLSSEVLSMVSSHPVSLPLSPTGVSVSFYQFLTNSQKKSQCRNLCLFHVAAVSSHQEYAVYYWNCCITVY